MTVYDRLHPFFGKVLSRFRLNKVGSTKETWHVVIDLAGSSISYRPGDSIGILPENDPALTRRVLDLLEFRGDEEVEDGKGGIFTIRDWLLKKANLASFSKRFLTELLARQYEPKKRQALENLLHPQHEELLREFVVIHDVEDVLAENREASWKPTDLAKALQPLLPRFYSIASSSKQVGDEVHLTVAKVKYSLHGKERLGVCSHFLCDLVELQESCIPLYLQSTRDFILPQDDTVPIIMVGPGTGVAPFRAFLQERMTAPGKNWLFFGERHQEFDFFYEEFWKELVQKNLLRLDCAFSRDQHERVYVQHKMWEYRKELWRWIQDRAVIYVCGDASKMAKDVDKCLHDIVREEGGLNEAEAKDFMKKLRLEKRYIRDVY